jgi:hypothetical protein
LAAATKYNVALIAIPFVLAFFVRAMEERGNVAKTFVDTRLYVGLASIVVGFVVGCPLVLIDLKRFLSGLLTYGDLQAQGKVGVGGGFFAYFTGQMSPGYGVFSHNSVPAAIGPALTLLGLVGVVRLLRGRNRVDWLVLSFVVPYYLVIGSVKYKDMRQFLPLLPFFLLAASTLLDALMGSVRKQRVFHYLAWGVLVASGVVP